MLNALGAAALGVLVWSPAALFEASFQMTFLAIVAIGGIAVPLGERSFLPYAVRPSTLGQVGGHRLAAARGAVSRDVAALERDSRRRVGSWARSAAVAGGALQLSGRWSWR